MGKRLEYFNDLTAGQSVSAKERDRLVRENWDKVAKERGDLQDATVRDLYARKLNTEAVCRWIQPPNRVIDVGCGNGFQTAEYAEKAYFTIGVDYIPDFVRCASRLHAEVAKRNYLQFLEGDVRDLAWILDKYGEFDRVVCERTIINLTCWEEQEHALNQLSSMVKLGGYLLLNEVTIQGHKSVDDIRVKYGLEPLEKHWNNLYLDEQKLRASLEKDFVLVHRNSYSLYALLSKVINAVLSLPDSPSFDAPINKMAYELSHDFSVKEDIGHTVFFVFKKEIF